METITIRLDYGNGPIWKDCVDLVTGALSTGIDIIDNDEELISLDEAAQDVYASLYELDGEGAFKFDEAREPEVKKELLDGIAKIKARLDEINDGSFTVVDEETERLSAL